MPKPNSTPESKKIIAFLVRAAAVAVFAILLVTMLPAAMPDTPDEDNVPEISLPFDDEMPEIDAVARPDLFPHIVIVYPEADAWGAEEADHLKARLASRFHAHFVILSDCEYLALGEDTLALYNTDPSLTLNLGMSKLLADPYLETISRLGSDGLEIKRTENRINITSPSLMRVHEGIEAFVSALTFDGSFNLPESFYISDARPSKETDFKPDFITDGELDILTFSYVDSNPYTLRAIEGIVTHTAPDLVVFNGNVDGGAKTRHELALLWQSISDILEKANTPWCFTPGNLSSSLPRITVCEVISSFPGCIRPIEGNESAAYSLTVANSEGIVTASIYIGDTFDDCSALCDLIEADSALYARASSYKRSITAILPALTDQLYDSVEELPGAYISDQLYDLYDSLKAVSADTFVCAADSVSTSIVEYSDGTLALCGSIGFDSHGLGGRFDYNNSLRGAVLLSITAHRADYSEAELSYIYAADLGLCER